MIITFYDILQLLQIYLFTLMNMKHYTGLPVNLRYAILHLIDYYYYYNFDVSFVVAVAQFPCSIKQNAKTKFNLFYNRRFANPPAAFNSPSLTYSFLLSRSLSLTLSFSLWLRFLLNLLLLH